MEALGVRLPDIRHLDEYHSKLPMQRWSELKRITKLPRDRQDESCPVCSRKFEDLLSEFEVADAMESPMAHVIGVLELDCGHTFCQRDLRLWFQRVCRLDFPSGI